MKRDPISGLTTDGEATIIAVPKPDILNADEREAVEMIRSDNRGGVEAHLLAIIDRIAPKPRT